MNKRIDEEHLAWLEESLNKSLTDFENLKKDEKNSVISILIGK